MQHLKEGLDPTPLTCLSKADILQMIRAAQPYPNQGFIIWADSAPDVVASPELAYFFWGKTVGGATTTPQLFYFYNGTSWELIPLVDGSLLANHTVDLIKLKMTGSSAFDIIQVDPTNSFFVFTSVVNAITADSIPPAKLKSPGAGDYVLTCFSNVKAFSTLAAFFAQVPSNTIPVDKLVRAGVDALGLYLRTKLDGSAIEWANIDVANLAGAGSIAGQAIRRNADNTAWEYYTPLNIATKLVTGVVPSGSGASTVIAHGLATGVKPVSLHAILVCVNANNDYVAGDEVPAYAFFCDDAAHTQAPAYSVIFDATNITVAPGPYGTVYVVKKNGGAVVSTPIVETDWTFKATILY